MRAVWLFSRNDVIGNAAVVVAAGLVWWTGTPWPDLAVALVTAGLFLQSTRLIIRDAPGRRPGADHDQIKAVLRDEAATYPAQQAAAPPDPCVRWIGGQGTEP